MWFLWLMIGVTIGGAAMHVVVQNEAKQHLCKFIRALLVSLETEEQYPRSAGSTKRTLQELLVELEVGIKLQ